MFWGCKFFKLCIFKLLIIQIIYKFSIISEDMKKELIKLRNNINALIDKYYNQN